MLLRNRGHFGKESLDTGAHARARVLPYQGIPYQSAPDCAGARFGCPGAQVSITLGARLSITLGARSRLPGSTIRLPGSTIQSTSMLPGSTVRLPGAQLSITRRHNLALPWEHESGCLGACFIVLSARFVRLPGSTFRNFWFLEDLSYRFLTFPVAVKV